MAFEPSRFSNFERNREITPEISAVRAQLGLPADHWTTKAEAASHELSLISAAQSKGTLAIHSFDGSEH